MSECCEWCVSGQAKCNIVLSSLLLYVTVCFLASKNSKKKKK